MKSPSLQFYDDLHQLQQEFAHALHYKDSQIIAQIAAGKVNPRQKIQIYRNNFIMSLTEVLATVYPIVKAMIGEACFEQLARQHILHHPLSQGDVSQYGDHFTTTITMHQELCDALPYLTDLAKLEWLRDEISRMPVHSHNFPLEKLQQLDHSNTSSFEEYCFHIPSATVCFNSPFSVASLWQIVTDELNGKQLKQEDNQQQDLLAELDINRPQSILIQHRPHHLWQQTISDSLLDLVKHCQQCKPLKLATTAMLEQLPLLIQYQITDDIMEISYDELYPRD